MNRTDLSKSPYERLAGALAEWPALLRRLRAQHPPTGICPACTTPGGRNVVEAPCAPRSLADRAGVIQRAGLISVA
ncbi:hypothetical protein ACQPWY_24270 [Pseudonocardia xinjiangensis]|uniref:hypothetical protein n=1 Tax=Pseudonocardia xinjiangensis TaxID=75289 RepID=UPI003D902173